ncbi:MULTISPECIES: c-type cytochrome [Caldimonas]|uniref:c-type cytochrome n=1 Tax=Caldimonas TaxID=196013 RepID=UPI0003725F47|nr:MULTISPECIES: c-type cytochrome [Caldimonas]GIX23182.1 MAG: hypothetical protein KatS3mg122_0413 [Caldimonas sp.]
MKKFKSTMTALAAAAGLSAFYAGAALAQDVKAGEAKVAMCIGCHGIPGYQASFPEIHKVPMISGQNAKYIVAALNAYKKGERKHPTMRGIAESLSEQDMADIAAFYEQQVPPANVPDAPARTPRAEVAALLEKGGCVACHGANFNKPIDAGYPKIAGQHADYLYVALKSYKTEGNPIIGRGNAIMAGQVKPFTDAELKAMAQYIASLPGDLRVVPQSRFRIGAAR